MQQPHSVAVVTGGSSGIGAATARLLTDRGWRCVLLARGEERLREVASVLGAEYEVCDVGDRAAVDRTAAAVRARHPAIRLLVNNAGIPARGSFLDLPAERVDEVTRVNYLGGVWCVRAFLPTLEAGAPAHLVNVVSIAGTIAYGRSGPYTAAKHAQLAFSRGIAPELGRRGIATHTINPGFVETPGFPQRTRLPPLLRPLVIDPEQVAERILRTIARDRREVFVPGWYRAPAVLHALLPGLSGRLIGFRGSRQRPG